MPLIHFTAEGFDRALASHTPMLVDFWATWCVHCKPLTAVMEQLAEEYEGENVIIGKVDVDQEPALAARYGVMGVPTVLLLENGEEAARQVGAMPCDVYTELIDGALARGRG